MPERAAELGAGLRDARRGAGPLRRRRADDELGRQAEDRRQAERDDDRRDDHDGSPSRAADLGQHDQPDGGERRGRRPSGRPDGRSGRSAAPRSSRR